MSYVYAVQGGIASWGSSDHDFAQLSGNAPSATSTTVSATGIQDIDALLSGSRWSGPITYSFPDARSDYEAAYSEPNASGFGSISFNQMQAARYILEGASPYAGGPRMSMTAFEQFTLASIRDAGIEGGD